MFCFFLFLFFFFFVRATSPDRKPSLFVFSCFFVWYFVLSSPFLSLSLIKNPVCFPKKGTFFVYFWLFPFLSPWRFLASPFSTFFFSASLFLFSFFLPSCLSFLLSFGSLFLSLSFFLLLLCFCFMKKSNIKIFNSKAFVHQSFLIFVGFLSSFLIPIPFPYLYFFFLFYVLLFVQHQCFFKKSKFKTPIFGEEGVATQRVFFFMNLCFAKCQKLSFFLGGLFWGQYLVQVERVLKNANLDQIMTPQMFARSFFSKQMFWNPYFYSVLTNRV